MPADPSRGKRRAARPPPSRISDTRVLCVPTIARCDSGLSVAEDIADRPVHERARSVDTRCAARRPMLELSSGMLDVEVMS